MEYYVFAVCIRDKTDRTTIKQKWPEMVSRAKPENKIAAESAHAAVHKFAEKDCKHPRYSDYVAGRAPAIELALNVVVEYVPRAHTCYTIDIV